MTTEESSLPKQSMAQIDELVSKIETLPDPTARRAAVELVRAVMDLHAAALDRILEITAVSAPQTIEALGADDLVSRVLVLHGLHPDDFHTRFTRAFEKLERYFDSRGARIELLEVTPGGARVRFAARRSGAGAAARQMIEDVIYESTPELGELIVEGIEEEHETAFVPLASLLRTT
jgi:hypothetical protein